MRTWGCILALSLGAGCVDLKRPPELDRPPSFSPDPDAGAGASGPEASAPFDGGPRDAAVDSSALPPEIAVADAQPAAMTPDASGPGPAPADALPPPDAAVPPDLAADRASPPALVDAAPLAPDAPPLAPDTAPDRAPDLARDLAADLPLDLPPPPPDGPPVLVIDDFSNTVAPYHNNLGSAVTSDHETCTRTAGELVCVYQGSGGYHDFIEPLHDFCGYDARAYAQVRFRLRTSVPGQQVDVYAGTNGGGCSGQVQNLLGTVTTTTTMTSYSFDIRALVQTRSLLLIELDPKWLDATQFIYDDLELVP
jgi:hypothetical protein